MRELKFYKETDNRWYVDLPDWKGSKAELEMVLGADSMLEYMSEGTGKVCLCISESHFDNSDLISLQEILPIETGGANYFISHYKGIEINLHMWLCDVMLHVFNSFPNRIYVSLVN